MDISVSKNNEVLRGGASRANRGYVLAHCGGGGCHRIDREQCFQTILGKK